MCRLKHRNTDQKVTRLLERGGGFLLGGRGCADGKACGGWLLGLGWGGAGFGRGRRAGGGGALKKKRMNRMNTPCSPPPRPGSACFPKVGLFLGGAASVGQWGLRVAWGFDASGFAASGFAARGGAGGFPRPGREALLPCQGGMQRVQWAAPPPALAGPQRFGGQAGPRPAGRGPAAWKRGDERAQQPAPTQYLTKGSKQVLNRFENDTKTGQKKPPRGSSPPLPTLRGGVAVAETRKPNRSRDQFEKRNKTASKIQKPPLGQTFASLAIAATASSLRAALAAASSRSLAYLASSLSKSAS